MFLIDVNQISFLHVSKLHLHIYEINMLLMEKACSVASVAAQLVKLLSTA